MINPPLPDPEITLGRPSLPDKKPFRVPWWLSWVAALIGFIVGVKCASAWYPFAAAATRLGPISQVEWLFGVCAALIVQAVYGAATRQKIGLNRVVWIMMVAIFCWAFAGSQFDADRGAHALANDWEYEIGMSQQVMRPGSALGSGQGIVIEFWQTNDVEANFLGIEVKGKSKAGRGKFMVEFGRIEPFMDVFRKKYSDAYEAMLTANADRRITIKEDNGPGLADELLQAKKQKQDLLHNVMGIVERSNK